MKQIEISILLFLISIITMSCAKKNNSLEVGISDVLHKTFFRHKNCNSDFYYNILVKNDSIFIDGKLNNMRGNHIGLLTGMEINKLNELIDNIDQNQRLEREMNPTRGMTALLIRQNRIVSDSLVDFTTEWGKTDLKLFEYIGQLICEKNLIITKDSIIYPTWEMVKPYE
jgi:hypothetical protein